MKKLFSILIAVVMAFSVVAVLAACNNNEIPDEMTSEDGKYAIAMVTDIGQLKDKSFNEGTWNGVKQFAHDNNYSYKYYQPANGANASDTDRIDAFQRAIDNGAQIIVCPGFAFGDALAEVVPANPNVKFVFIDGWNIGQANLVGYAFEEQQCGYLAGYAAVKEGYTKLGGVFGGGSTNAACNRYAYGYLQGIDAAAKEAGKTVEVKITHKYAATFSPSAELKSMMTGWYNDGTEVVFACGGSISDSIFSAAEEANKKSIGVDVDQSSISTSVITSALKGLKEAVIDALTTWKNGKWDAELADKLVTLGANKDAVGLPTATWSLKNFTVSDYNTLMSKIKNGSVTIATCGDDWSVVSTAVASMANINYFYVD